MSRKSVTGVVAMLTLAVVMVASSLATAQTGCSQYNENLGPYISGHSDSQQHVWGSHQSAFSATGKCTYVGPAPSACQVTSEADEINPSESETGLLWLPVWHVSGVNVAGGVATNGRGQSATSHAMGAVVFESCISPFCAASVSFSGSGTSGYTVNFPPDKLWGDSYPYDNTCPGRSAPPAGGGGCSGPNCGLTPVAVDTGNIGFEKGFSNPQTNCVTFDYNADGHPLCASWPLADSGIGWLVLPGKHGEVTSGLQMFGNTTPQANHVSPDPNGFLALAEWDMPSNGGNWDLIIDKQDAIWKRLRVWIDTYCQSLPDTTPCTAVPSDLHTLEEFGITNISLVYSSSESWEDQYHNRFRFATHLNVKPHKLQEAAADSRTAFDVYLQVRKP